MNDTSNSTEQTHFVRGGSQTDLRRYNERIVLAALDRYPGLFNAELARRTGLAAQTISVILRALAGQGLIERGPALRGRRGQPATPLFLKPDAAFGFGAAICWRGLYICLSDFSGNILAEERVKYEFPDFDDAIEKLARATETLNTRLEADERERLTGIGLALPGAIDRCLTALGAPAAVIRSWQSRDFIAELARATDMPVWQTSYGAAASDAEMRRTGNGGAEDFAYFFVGTLLMGGIVSANGAMSASGPSGAMLGAMVVNGADGTAVRADTIVSGWGLESVLAAKGIAGPVCVDPDWDWKSSGNAVEHWLDSASEALAHVIVNTQCAFDINKVVIDGILPNELFVALIERVERVLADLPEANGPLPMVQQGNFGARGAMLGAARLPFYQRFFTTEPDS